MKTVWIETVTAIEPVQELEHLHGVGKEAVIGMKVVGWKVVCGLHSYIFQECPTFKIGDRITHTMERTK